MSQPQAFLQALRALISRLRSPLVISGIASIALVAILIYVLTLTWTGTAPEETVKRIYFADNISPAHRKVIDLFNRRHTGKIEVVPIDMPFEKFSTNERKELFARFLRSKSDQIDIFTVDVVWVPRFARWCEPLDAYLPPKERQEILGSALEACSYQDTLATVPLFLDVALMYYRKDLLRRLPDAGRLEQEIQSSITWERLFEVARTLRDPSQYVYVFQADSYEGLMCSFGEIMEGLGAPLQAGEAFNLSAPAAVEGVTLLHDLVVKHHLSPPGVTEFRENTSLEYYLRNNCLFLRGWPTSQRDLQTLAPANGIDLHDIRRAPLPHFAGHPPVSMLGGWNLMISKYSSHKPEAALFLKFLLGREAQMILYQEGGYLPVNASIYADSALVAQHEELRFYRDLFRTGVRRPALVEYTKYSDILTRFLKRALKGELPPEAALRLAAAEIEAERLAQE